MEKWQVKHIRKNLPCLVKTTKCDIILMTILIKNNIFTPEDVCSLEIIKNDVERSFKLYTMLETRNSSYNIFINALEETNQSGVVKILQGGTLKRSDSVSDEISVVKVAMKMIIQKAGKAESGKKFLRFVLSSVKELIRHYLSKEVSPWAVTLYMSALEEDLFNESLNETVLQAVERIHYRKLEQIENLLEKEVETQKAFLEGLQQSKNIEELHSEELQINLNRLKSNAKISLTENQKSYLERRFRQTCKYLLELKLSQVANEEKTSDLDLKEQLEWFYMNEMNTYFKNIRKDRAITKERLEPHHKSALEAMITHYSYRTKIHDSLVLWGEEFFDKILQTEIIPSEKLNSGILAIDFGTNHTRLVAHVNGNLSVIRNVQGHQETLSSLKSHGTESKKVKSFLTQVVSDKAVFSKGNIELSLSQFFQKLKKDSEASVGYLIKKVAFSIPTYFNSRQRCNIIDASKIAGMEVTLLVNDTIAAAVACTMKDDFKTKNKSKVLVFEMGESSTQASVVEIDLENRKYTVLISAGDSTMGGGRIDINIAKHCWDLFFPEKSKYNGVENEETKRSRLLSACEIAKIELDHVPSTEILVPYFHNGLDFRSTLYLEKFNELNKLLFQNTIDLICSTLNGFDVKKDISHVILVGKATRIPRLQQLLKQQFHMNKFIQLDESALAFGAATIANKDNGKITVSQVTTESVLIKVIVNSKTIHSSLVIPKTSKIPTDKVTLKIHWSEPQALIRFYQGNKVSVRENPLVAEYLMFNNSHERCCPPQRNILVWLDSWGILQAEIDFVEGEPCLVTLSENKLRFLEIGEIISLP